MVYIYHVGDRRDERLKLGNGGKRILASVDYCLGISERGLGIEFGMNDVSIYIHLPAVP